MPKNTLRQTHQDENELLTKLDHPKNVIHQKIPSFMDIVMLELVNPNLVSHISKKFQKTEKKLGVHF